MSPTDKLRQALLELGKTEKEIVESLQAQKIKGFRDDGDHCPIANYLRDVKKYSYVNVSSDAIDVITKETGKIIRLEPDKIIQEFVKNFDAGVYLDLEWEENGYV